MALKKIAEVEASKVEGWECDALEELVNSNVYDPLESFLLAIIKSLREGKDVALYVMESNFPDTIEETK